MNGLTGGFESWGAVAGGGWERCARYVYHCPQYAARAAAAAAAAGTPSIPPSLVTPLLLFFNTTINKSPALDTHKPTLKFPNFMYCYVS